MVKQKGYTKMQMALLLLAMTRASLRDSLRQLRSCAPMYLCCYQCPPGHGAIWSPNRASCLRYGCCLVYGWTKSSQCAVESSAQMTEPYALILVQVCFQFLEPLSTRRFEIGLFGSSLGVLLVMCTAFNWRTFSYTCTWSVSFLLLQHTHDPLPCCLPLL